MENISAISSASQTPTIFDSSKGNDPRGPKDQIDSALKSWAESPDNKAQKTDSLASGNEPGKAAKGAAIAGRFSLHFETDGELNIIVAKIIDEKTGDVVSQIPPEQMFKTMKYLKDNPGRLINRQA